MNQNSNGAGRNQKTMARYIYLLSVFFLTLTGLGQMPIFKRYYIADIPGFGWLGQFYVTHYMHYLFAILLIAIITYMAVEYLLGGRKKIKITMSGYVRAGILLLLVITGGLLVIRNFAASNFNSSVIIFLDIAHVCLFVAILTAGMYCTLFKKKWAETNRETP
ncbi:MAG: hypothetical protein JRE58_05460 [Deltaproteobacteria bacterium]|nr:hypothetical protein [Deltaproteobacteria bacterium]